MKTSFASFIFGLSFLLALVANGQGKKEVMDNHIEVVGTLNKVHTHSISLANEIKKWRDPVKIAEGRKIYMETRAEISGAITKYKSVITNPKLSKTPNNKEQFASVLNSVIASNNKFVAFYDANYKSFVDKPVSSFVVETWMINLVKEIGLTLYQEIDRANKARRAQYAKEADDEKLAEWDKIEK